MRKEYEAWFIGKFGFPPMPIHSRVMDFCWEGYQAGVESMNKPVSLSGWQKLVDENELLRQQLEQAHADIAGLHDQLEEPQIAQDDYRLNKLELEQLRQQLAAALADSSTAWAQAHRLALELECLIMDTKDNAVVSKWWDSAFEAMEEYHKLKPGAAEDAEAWAKLRKAGI